MSLVTNIQHAPFGPITALTFGNGISETRSFDQEGRISRIQSTALDFGYTWSTTGNITAITDNLDATRTQSFNYDALYRLTDASGIYGDLAYGYDAVGNRETQTATPPSGIPETTTYTYAATPNRLSTITDASGVTTYQYDANGNTTDNGNHAFAYDDRNRLVSADVANSYAHNALGQRAIKTTTTGTVLFVYDEAGHLLGEYDAIGNPIRQYVWLEDRPAAMLISNGTGLDMFYIHSDHLNTPKVVTDQNQVVVWKADYEPFGEAEPTVTTLDMPLRFPGQYSDSETNLHYNYFRTYEPATGRYSQTDPMGINEHIQAWADGEGSLGLNPYLYVDGNPITRLDPDGENWIFFAAAIGAYIAYEGYQYYQYYECVKGCENRTECDSEDGDTRSLYRCKVECTLRYKGGGKGQKGPNYGPTFGPSAMNGNGGNDGRS